MLGGSEKKSNTAKGAGAYAPAPFQANPQKILNLWRTNSKLKIYR